ITYTGFDSGSGIWICTKDCCPNCTHITNAHHYLQKLVTMDPDARDNQAG
ncbi:hypothetical protein SERLA73DRAFT_63856, partial [Serpula lacrymans var. lacrymans S7.3]